MVRAGEKPTEPGRARSRAAILADVRRLRALARTARQDGMPQAELRVRHVRAAVRVLLVQARTATYSPASAKNLLLHDANPAPTQYERLDACPQD